MEGMNINTTEEVSDTTQEVSVTTQEVRDIIQEANEARKAYSKLGVAYLGAAILNIVPAIVVFAVAMRVKPELVGNSTFSFVVSIVTLYLIGLPFAFFMIKDMPKCEIGNKKLNFGQIISSMMIGYFVIVAANLVGSMINMYIGRLTGKGLMNPIANVLTGVNPIVNILIVAILAPMIEEYVFRKLLVDRVYKYGEGFTILFSGLMFGLFHANFAQFFYAFTLGIYFAYIYMRTGKIRYTIYIHCFINLIGSLTSFAAGGLDIEKMQGLLFSGDTEGYLAFVNEHLGEFALLSVFGFVILIIVFTGFVLALVFQKKFHIDKIDTGLPMSTGLKCMFGNAGMALFIIFFAIAIVLAQFGTSISNVLLGILG